MIPGGAVGAIGLPERFTSKFTADDNGCWIWNAGRKPGGYGVFYLDGRMVSAHRFSYQSLIGEIPPGLQLDHLCRTRPCVNPAHLEPVTPGENTRRSPLMGKHRTRWTACPKGHPYDEENTGRVNGNRRCLTCLRAAWKRKNARRRGAA